MSQKVGIFKIKSTVEIPFISFAQRRIFKKFVHMHTVILSCTKLIQLSMNLCKSGSLKTFVQ